MQHDINGNSNTIAAIESKLSEHLDKYEDYIATADTVPIGSIIAIYSETLPPRYLPCNGSLFNKDEYNALYNFLKIADINLIENDHEARTPDFQGYFLRGLDHKKQVDKETRILGGVQEDSIKEHAHRVYKSHVGGTITEFALIHSPTTSPSGLEQINPMAETRPKNKAINFIIRAL